MPSHTRDHGYHDLYFRIIISLLAGHMMIAFGAKESLFSLLISWFYYRDLFLSALIAFLLVNIVYLATVSLDKRFDWRRHTAARIGLQFLFGLVLSGIVAFMLAAGYYALFGYNILNTLYLRFDFPVVMIMLLLLNVYYLAFYFYRQWQRSEQGSAGALMGDHSAQKGKEVFVVQKGAKSIPLPVTSISYFYHEDTYNFARTFDREDFLIAQPLDEVQQQVSDQLFFRVNRQMLVSFPACEHFEAAGYGKIRLIIAPPVKEPVIISQKKAKLFKQWIAR